MGLFLLVAGGMILVLRPAYRLGGPAPGDQLEDPGLPDRYAEMPAWLGLAGVAAGGLLLASGLRAGRR